MLKSLRTSRRYLYVVLAPVVALLAICVFIGSASPAARAKPMLPGLKNFANCTQSYTVKSERVRGRSNGATYTLSFTQSAKYDAHSHYCGTRYTRASLTKQGTDKIGGKYIIMLSDSPGFLDAGYSEYIDAPEGGR